MGTRSAIIVKVGKEYKGIYCHWDGYPTGLGVGAKLHIHYNSQEKAEALIALGDLSSLREKLAPEEGTTHTFDNPQADVTVAYGRDRGETDPDYTHPKTGKTVEEVSNKIDCAYIYVFRNGRWMFRASWRKTLRNLAKVAEK